MTVERALRETTRVDDALALGWEDLLRSEDLFLGGNWLRVAQRTAGSPMRYLARLDGDGPDAAPAAALATALATEKSPWVLGRPDTLLQFSAEAGREGAAELLAELPGTPADTLLPSLVCGGRHMGRSRVLRSPAAGRAAVGELVARAEEIAAEHAAASVAFPFVEGGDSVLREVLADRGYRAHLSGRYSSLPVTPEGFDGYLRRLSSKRQRRVRTERRRLVEAGVEMRTEPLTTELIPRLGVLEEQLMAKYGIAWTAAQTEEVLRETVTHFGGDAVVMLAIGDGQIRGFGTMLRFRDHWYARQAGFDYGYQQKLALYFETLYYFPVEMAAASGITTIHYGLGSEEAKRSRGCVAEDQFAYVLRLQPEGTPHD
ncbi:GNAT family N-acetyltransferase [Streptomyces sp. NBC_01142]|uniref:GNAT family N-acetyltransferase n=1 Tax=Streptomyces sp. NBC_01142 TaxID=2975865 RepID=UPI002257FD50|nr:GNAT family N-acetyltransferase [Streptomyces sp. NBC_01142]MCX4823168.1 GNAT family N-acetyltransferase [Streptomyces sp. NBC_01142]